MTGFLESFIVYWEYVFYLSIPIMLACFLYQTGMFWGWVPMLTRRKIAYLWIGILQLGLTGYIYSQTSSYLYNEKFNGARLELASYLQKPEELTISINGKLVDTNKDSVIINLGKSYLKSYYHHSRPDKKLNIELGNDSSNKFHILLRRDSDDPREYWVYFPQYNFKEEVGKLLTDSFKEY